MFHDPNYSTDAFHHVHPNGRNPTVPSAFIFHWHLVGFNHIKGPLACGVPIPHCHCTLGTFSDYEDECKEEQRGET